MGDFVKGVVGNIVASFLWWGGPVMIPVVLAILAVVNDYDWFQVLLVFCGALVGAVIFTNQARQLLPKRKRWRTDKDMERGLSDWLREAGYKVEYPAIDTEDPVARDALRDVVFVFVATMADRPVTIVRTKDAPGVRMQCVVRPDQNHADTIAAMNDIQASTLREALGLELARFGLGFDARDILGLGIVIDYPIVITDNVTQYQFVERVGFVARAIMLVQFLVTRNVRAAEIESASPSPTPIPLSSPDMGESPQ